jgi:hypothetical protein
MAGSWRGEKHWPAPVRIAVSRRSMRKNYCVEIIASVVHSERTKDIVLKVPSVAEADTFSMT